MSSALWIPCFNEWTQHVEFIHEWLEYANSERNKTFFSGDRHAIYETLQLMKSRIDAGLFDEVIITNDGSTDDTLDGIKRFKRENNYRDSVFRILHHEDNAGKMQRFFEAFYGCNEDVFVMTDADMVSAWWDTFSILSNPASYNEDTATVISPVFEATYTGYLEWINYSWTRGHIREKVVSILGEKGIWLQNIPGRGYGLEMALNYHLRDSKIELESWLPHNIPRFLESFRKDQTIQWADKNFTFSFIEKESRNKLKRKIQANKKKPAKK